MTIDSLKAFGANVDEGLERCMGMEDFYIEMIELGISDERFENLGTFLQEDNLDAAYEYSKFTDENDVERETRASIINYLVDKYSNLEVLFNWLDSTDRSDPTLISKSLLSHPAGPWQTLEAGTDTGEVSIPVYTYTKLGDSALYNENTTYYTYANGEYTEANITSFLNYQAVASLMTGKNYYKFVNDEYI